MYYYSHKTSTVKVEQISVNFERGIPGTKFKIWIGTRTTIRQCPKMTNFDAFGQIWAKNVQNWTKNGQIWTINGQIWN